MSTLQRCLNYFEAQHVRYVHTVHPAAYTAKGVAAAEHMPTFKMAKVVVFSGEGYFFVVVPADKNVDVGQIRIATGIRELRVASEAEIFLLFPNSEVGAMPPLGPIFEMPVYLDRELAEQPYIAFNAGTHRDVIHMPVGDFTKIVRPVIGDFSRAAIPELIYA